MTRSTTAEGPGANEASPSPRDQRAEALRSGLERRIRIVEQRPDRAIGTATTRVSVGDGVTCTVADGPWQFTFDIPARWGGADEGPNPGVYGRATLGACLSVSYLSWAAMSGIPIDRLEVEVQADYDARGELGLADVTPGYTAVRLIVEVESPADPEEIRRVFEKADECCPYLQIWERPLAVERDIRISAPEGG